VTGETLSPEDDVITDFGRKQATALGESLKDVVKFTRAYASTYQRAYETANGVISCQSSPPELKKDPRIREREMGDLVGLPAKQIGMLVLGKLKEGEKFDEMEVPGGETVAEYTGRIHGFFKELFDELRQSETPETVLIVSHGLMMRRFLVGLEGTFEDLCSVSNFSPKCRSVIENTACTTFTVEYPENQQKPVVTFLKVHDTEHLQELNRQAEANGEEGPKQAKFAINEEEKKKLVQMILSIPGAKEQASGCIQV